MVECAPVFLSIVGNVRMDVVGEFHELLHGLLGRIECWVELAV